MLELVFARGVYNDKIPGEYYFRNEPWGEFYAVCNVCGEWAKLEIYHLEHYIEKFAIDFMRKQGWGLTKEKTRQCPVCAA